MIWILFIFGIFGISIVAVLMGICLLFERTFHRSRLRPITRDTWWMLRSLAERERGRVKPLTERDLVWEDFLTFWSIVALAMLVFVRKRVREYGAMLLGFMFVPTAHYLADLHVGEGRSFATAQGPGIVTATLLACVTLFIMWRVFGPGANQPPVATNV